MALLKNSFVLAACIVYAFRSAYAAGEVDTMAGEVLYTQCVGCHSPSYHRTGPKHCGLLGRQAGSTAEFNFTEAMKRSNIVWTKTTLDKFLQAPLAMIPGTSMGYAGITSREEREHLILFLSTLDETNPLCR